MNRRIIQDSNGVLMNLIKLAFNSDGGGAYDNILRPTLKHILSQYKYKNRYKDNLYS